MTDQLPATIDLGDLTLLLAVYRVPALVAQAGEQAGWRYIDFFTSNIRNPNTRRAYARACGRFLGWCEDRGLTLTTIRPLRRLTLYRGTHAHPHGAGGQAAAKVYNTL